MVVGIRGPEVWRGPARRGAARPGEARHGMARQDGAGLGVAWKTSISHSSWIRTRGLARCGLARLGAAWPGAAWKTSREGGCALMAMKSFAELHR